MHAASVLQKCFADVFASMHAGRVRVLTGAVCALLSSRRLVLMDLARAWPGAERVRAPLKRLDRLLSNRHLHAEQLPLYTHMARLLVRSATPVIIVDWSTLKDNESWHVLRAGLAVGGRTVTVYEEVHSQRKQQSPAVHRAFLQCLKQVLPTQTRPIIVTDAGFRCPWFSAVEALGWHWVGRVRNQVCVRSDEQAPWRLLCSLLTRTAKLRLFGTVQLVRKNPFTCQLLRYYQPLKGRKHRTVRGRVSRNTHSRAAARSRREPWLLAYSNSLQTFNAVHIVNLYKRRMQIELSFRDLKCPRYGCAFRHSLTRKGARVAVLLLLLALASFLAWVQGLAAVHLQQTLHCVIRLRRERARYSLWRIGWESLQRQSPSPPFQQWTLNSLAACFAMHLDLDP